MFLWLLLLCEAMYTYIVYRYRTLIPQKLLIFVVLQNVCQKQDNNLKPCNTLQ